MEQGRTQVTWTRCALAATLAFSCNSPGSERQDGPDAVPLPRLAPFVSVRSSDSLTFEVSDAALGPDRTTLVLDGNAHQVLRFDSLGRLQGRFGRRGSGPGELQLAKDLEVGEDSVVAIADVGNGRIGYWTMDGSWLGHFAPRRWVHDLAWTHDGLYAKFVEKGGLRLQRIPRREQDPPNNGGLLSRGTMDTSGAEWTFGQVDVVSPDRGLFAHPDSSYLALEVDSLGRVTREFRRPDIRPVAYTSAERAARETRFRSAAATRPALRSLPVPVFKPMIADIAVDRAHRVWILRHSQEGAEPPVDVFSSEGEYQGTLMIPAPARRMEIQAEYLIAFGPDTTGESVVTVFRY